MASLETREAVEAITTLNDSPWRWKQGIQAGLAMGIPAAIFTVAGQQSQGMIAYFGGFLSLYCADRSTKERMIALPFVGAGLIVAAALGVLSAFNEWLTIISLILVTALSVVFTIGIGLGPPGPIMIILTSAVCNHLAAPVHLGGTALQGDLIVMLVAEGAVIAYLVVIGLSIFIYSGPEDEKPEPPSLNINFDKDSASMAMRIIFCVAIASLISKPLEAHRSFWLVVAAVAVLQGGNSNKRTTTIRAIERLLGTLLGVLVFQIISLAKPAGLWIVLIIILFQFATQVVIARNYTLALIFITPLALIATTIGRLNDSYVSIQGRIIDTLYGSIIALVIFWCGEIILRLTSKVYPSRETLE